MWRRSVFTVATMSLFGVAAPVHLLALSTGAITGTVADQQTKPMPGVKVTVRGRNWLGERADWHSKLDNHKC